ncbi:stalk domain-containing protein [Paenibacillus amylolyticus]|uniref:stalk domain-containing protein n=1 Tax=Paenibacillus amylolyticus TaxID=1451 RepID=UPI00211B62EC|nr:stalk domain-containing protein [Paenibacillus amylolyticus]
MKKLLTKLPTFMLGAIVGVAVTAGSAVGAATYFKATQSNVKIVVDGSQAKLSESPLNVNGKLYLPVRDTANALGYSVQSVTTSQVSLKESATSSNTTSPSNNNTSGTPSNSTNNNSTSNKKVNNLKETYSTDGKLDAEKIRTALNNGTLDVNSVDSASGNSLLHLVVLENNFEAYKAIKRNALDPNIQNTTDKQTPLHLAVINNNSFFRGELLDNLKVDATLKDSNSKQAIDYTEKGSSDYYRLQIYMM